MSETQILDIDAEAEVANCSVTEYAFAPEESLNGGLKLVRYNFVVPIERGGVTVTAEPDANVAAR
jgi:2,3-bisphosphoglycerate-dependent phosphoglycerate mutase